MFGKQIVIFERPTLTPDEIQKAIASDETGAFEAIIVVLEAKKRCWQQDSYGSKTQEEAFKRIGAQQALDELRDTLYAEREKGRQDVG